jgi:hypothetical protein
MLLEADSLRIQFKIKYNEMNKEENGGNKENRDEGMHKENK